MSSIRFSIINVALLSTIALFASHANAAKISVALTGQGMSLKCSAGYAARGMACPTIVGAAPTNCGTDWVGIPAMTIPSNMAGATISVPAFCVMKYIASQNGATAVSSATTAPWTGVTWLSASTACGAAGGRLMRESEWMALAHNLVNVDANWSGGAVDNGNVNAGLQGGEVSTPTAPSGVSAAGRIRVLSTGETVWDIGGNVFQWTYHDLVGGVGGTWGAMPLAQRTAPYAEQTRGMGQYYSVAAGYSDGSTLLTGSAPVRGGWFNDGSMAGPFRFVGFDPTSSFYHVGFRCTK